MDPLIGGAAILGAVNLIGGLFNQASQRAQQEKQMQFNLAQQQSQLEQAGIQQAMQGKQQALAGLVEAYRAALMR